ncbi:hypothetical protein LPJ74_005570 [Coemansia sp. RSA 1843]|nr:hypothetical protein LPJ74_005570 [Coemansia sp. RSA 1843]
MRGIIYITTGLLLVGFASGKVFVNVPSELDPNVVKAALSEHGIQNYDSFSGANANGIYPAKIGQQQQQQQQLKQQEIQEKSGQLPSSKAPSSPPLPPSSQLPLHPPPPPTVPPPPPSKQAEVPLVPAHGASVGLQSDPSNKVLTSTVVHMSTTTVPLALATPAIGNVGQAREKPPMTVSIAGGPPLPQQQQQQQPQPPQQPQQQAAPAEDEEEIIEEEEIEEEVTTTIKPAAAAGATITPATAATSPASAKNNSKATMAARPEMLARASASAFKPTDIDKFTFPSSEMSVNMSGPRKDSNNKNSSSNIGFHASMPTASPDQPASSSKLANGKSASVSNSENSAKPESSPSSRGSSSSSSPKKPFSSPVNDVDKDSGAAAPHSVRAASSAAAIAVAIAAIGGILI